jgi:hypothetical protein
MTGDQHRRCTDATEGVCALHPTLEGNLTDIKQSLQRIEGRLGTGDISLATLALRVEFLEKCVYGAVALALTGVVGSILALVLKGGAG